ncbi:MAG: PAS domain-containing protein, partial [Steroidobacteraceae bacterium]
MIHDRGLSAPSHLDSAPLLDALSTGIILLDSALCPLYANVAAQDLLAFSLNQVRGRPFGDCLHESNGLFALLNRALETGEGFADREIAVHPRA